MPLYEYVCLDCKNRFDALRSIKDADASIACPSCRSDHASRQLSVFFAHSDGRLVAQSGAGCAGCSGGACASCSCWS